MELTEDNYVQKVIIDIWDNLPLLIVADAVFIVFCIPWFIFMLAGLNMLSLWSIVFATPAFAGIMYVAGKIAKGESCKMKDLFFGICRFFRRALMVGIITVLLLFISIQTLRIITANPEQKWLMLPWIFQLSCLTFLGVLHTYIFPVMTLYDTNLKIVFTTSLTLVVKYKMPTIGMISLMILMALTARLIWIGLILVFPAVLAIFMSNLTFLLVKKHQQR